MGPRRREKETSHDVASWRKIVIVVCQSAHVLLPCVFSFLISFFFVCVFAFAQNMTASCSCACSIPASARRISMKIFKSLLHWFSLAFSFCPAWKWIFWFFFFFFFNFCGILNFWFLFFYAAACMIWHNFDELFWVGLGSCCYIGLTGVNNCIPLWLHQVK